MADDKRTHGSIEPGIFETPQDEARMTETEKGRKVAFNKERLDALCLSLAKSRSEAIQGRDTSGIENEWAEDEEHYDGIDDTNRGEMAAWRQKPVGAADIRTNNQNVGSTVFINITRPYCDAASARIGDMLLPTDDKAWSIVPTPIPSMVNLADGKVPADIEAQIQEANPDDPETQEAVRQGVIDEATKIMAEAKEKAEKASRRIEDWHVECQYHAEMRLVIEDCSKLGTGVLKGPIPENRKKVAMVDGKLKVKKDVKPGSRRIDPWNFYPDAGCGENIHQGGYTWERDDITPAKLRTLRGLPGYLDEQIELCLLEGPHKAIKEIDDRTDSNGLMPRDKTHLYEIWYYYGPITREDFAVMGKELKEDDTSEVNALITMVNNHVIAATRNPLPGGQFPYDVMPYTRRVGMPWGLGVSRQVRTPQRVVNGGARNMMDNAGRAGGPQLIIQHKAITPENGRYELSPWKIWFAREDLDLDHLDKAFRFEVVPMLQGELENIINLGLRLAEDTTGLTMILQGQMGQRTPDTLGGMEMLNNNASSVLRRIARTYDDMVTEPHIRRYYDYLLKWGPEEDEKDGDFTIDARGSSALIERYAQSEEMMKLTEYVANPMYGIDPKKWFEEILKSRRLDPRRFAYDDNEWKKVVEQLMSQPEDPRTAVKQIEIEWLREKLDKEFQQKGEQMGLELQQDLKRSATDAQEKGEELAMVQMHEKAMAKLNAELDVMTEEGKKDMSLADIKAMLAKTVMTLRSQEKLAGLNGGDSSTPEVATPAAEPPGRAEDGKAFTQ